MSFASMAVRSALLGAVAALAVLWLHGNPASAHDVHPGLFHIGIDVDGDTEDDCDTAGGPAKCAITSGSTFWLRFYLDDTGYLAYEAYDLVLSLAGVTPTFVADFSPWPDCRSPSSNFLSSPMGVGCRARIPGPPSSYAGLMVRVQFACTASGSIAMLHGPGGTTVLEPAPLPSHQEAPSGSEALDIKCVPPPTPADVGGLSFDPPTAAGAGDTVPRGAAILAAAMVAGTLALGGAAWGARRRARR